MTLVYWIGAAFMIAGYVAFFRATRTSGYPHSSPPISVRSFVFGPLPPVEQRLSRRLTILGRLSFAAAGVLWLASVAERVR